ncbi:hypothetical protein FKP32DRAFT_1688551 [Trametes sanguinea]|nr:hypothetical protein FKP32DRAFT_1688551 [Trametes sanguinea]
MAKLFARTCSHRGDHGQAPNDPSNADTPTPGWTWRKSTPPPRRRSCPEVRVLMLMARQYLHGRVVIGATMAACRPLNHPSDADNPPLDGPGSSPVQVSGVAAVDQRYCVPIIRNAKSLADAASSRWAAALGDDCSQPVVLPGFGHLRCALCGVVHIRATPPTATDFLVGSLRAGNSTSPRRGPLAATRKPDKLLTERVGRVRAGEDRIKMTETRIWEDPEEVTQLAL